MITNTELEQKGNQFPNIIKSFHKKADKFTIITENDVLLEITVVRDSMFRFRYATEGNLHPDFSYAIDENATHGYNELSHSEEENEHIITTSKLVLKIDKKNLNLVLYQN